MHAFNLSTQEAEAGGFLSSVYRTARATQRNPVSKNKKKKKKKIVHHMIFRTKQVVENLRPGQQRLTSASVPDTKRIPRLIHCSWCEPALCAGPQSTSFPSEPDS